MTQSNTSSTKELEIPLESQRARGQLKSPKMKRSLEEGRMEGEKELFLPSVGEERIGGACTLRNKNKEELFREMLTPT